MSIILGQYCVLSEGCILRPPYKTYRKFVVKMICILEDVHFFFNDHREYRSAG